MICDDSQLEDQILGRGWKVKGADLEGFIHRL